MARPAAKKKAPKVKDICFVIMPFGGWFDSYYRDIYCPAIRTAGLEPHRADDLYRPSAIIQDIWAYTKKAKIVLADISGKNPNVFYELGLAHAITKPAILVTESLLDVPFDLRALRVHEYDKNISDWGKILRKKIELSLAEILKSPKESILPVFSGAKDAKDSSAEAIQEQNIHRMFVRTAEDMDNEDRLLGSRRIVRSSSEARQFMHELLRSGVPESLVIERLTESGVPPSWVLNNIRRLRSVDTKIGGKTSSNTARKRK